jgi:hypothetical protein
MNRPSDALGDFNPLASHHSSLLDPNGTQLEGENSQFLRDRESSEFFEYIAEEAHRSGQQEGDKIWVEFEKVAVPGNHSREVAAQAFYHTLVLATKDRISVRQEDDEGIHMGITASDIEVVRGKARGSPQQQGHDGERPMPSFEDMEMGDLEVSSSDMDEVVHHVEYDPMEDDAVMEDVDGSFDGDDEMGESAV